MKKKEINKMSKKSLLTLLSITCVLAVSFIIYTICAAFVGVDKSETFNQYVVLRVGDVCVYTNASYSKPTNEENSIIKVNENGELVANYPGEVVATTTKGNDTYNYYITVVAKGEGTVEDPRVLVSEEHLKEMATEEDNSIVYALYNDIEIHGVWEPIQNFNGTLTSVSDEVYTISGVRIYVDAAKAEAMKNESRVNVGFFGKLSTGAVVKNVNFDNVTIEVATDIEANTTTNILSVGALAGYANGANIENVSISSNIAAHATPRNGAAALNDNLAGVGGFVGAVNDCTFANVQADVTFNIVKGGALNTSSSSDTAYVVYGGIFGISQMSAESEVIGATTTIRVNNADAKAYAVSGIAGVAEANTSIKDCVVKNIQLVVSDKDVSSEFARDISGVVGVSKNANISNCHVENVNVQGIVNFSGIMQSNAGSSVENCSFAGTVTGAWYAFGYIGYNGGTVTITDAFAKPYMVNATLSAYNAVAGLSYQVGYTDTTGDHAGVYTSTAKTHAVVNANLTMLRPNYATTYARYLRLFDLSSAGLSVNVVAGSTISNIDVQGTITSTCSVGGAVAVLNNGTLEHVNVNIHMITGRDTYIVGGAVARLLDKGTLNDVKVNASLNEGKTETDIVAGTYVGGLIGNIGLTSANESNKINATIKDCAVAMNMYVNTSVVLGKVETEGEEVYKQYIGGIVGAIIGLNAEVTEGAEGAANITYSENRVNLTTALVFDNVSYTGTIKTDLNKTVRKEDAETTVETNAYVCVGKMIAFTGIQSGTLNIEGASVEANILVTYSESITAITADTIAEKRNDQSVVIVEKNVA